MAKQDGLGSVLARPLVRAGVITYGFSALTLAANLVGGIVTARGLGPHGRGIGVSLWAIALLTGFLFAGGAAQSLSYFIARDPRDAGRLLTTWALMLIPLSLIAVAITEALLTTIFGVHASAAVSTGRWFMWTIILVIAVEFNNGLLLGMHDFGMFNFLRFVLPALSTVGWLGLWLLNHLTVNTMLATATVATVVVLLIGLPRSVRRIGLARPDARLGLRTLWYGIRGHGVMVAANLNARLDVAMLPAFVAAASVGIYSVATNVSLIIYQLANTFAGLLIPAAARDAARAEVKILGALYATLAITGVLALGLGLFARPLLGLVYGDQFRQAAATLYLLLPGAVLFAGSSILTAGIYALGKPFTATLPQLVGTAVTVVGLLVFLRVGGITAAAIVSTASYGTVFVISAIAYKRAGDVPWRLFVPTPARVLALLR